MFLNIIQHSLKSLLNHIIHQDKIYSLSITNRMSCIQYYLHRKIFINFLYNKYIFIFYNVIVILLGFYFGNLIKIRINSILLFDMYNLIKNWTKCGGIRFVHFNYIRFNYTFFDIFLIS